ncbi:alanine racemase [Vagococcus vulneris]|uniref:Alanine racemase n=1 Tax=Vagococcus vulneris TaxID=1977869 RepID=A0A430A2P1_9ENTE|nr:alanine racemase [Vagococcus vulneris]RSU00729.1 alanine racemase [Vagococcus vulneris]
MIPSVHRESKVIVNLAAIKANVESEIKRLSEGQELFAVVKANGYGHGSVAVARTAIEAGATGFCVSNLDEGIELRDSGITLPILVLSYVSPDYLQLIHDYKLSVTCPSIEWLQQINKMSETCHLKSPILIHVKIDTGMGRIGIRHRQEMKEVVDFFNSNSNFILQGLFTHFSTADSVSIEHFELQQKRFEKARDIFPENIPYIHTANSATALWHDAWGSNMIRFGDAMYGLNPSGRELPEPYPLIQAISFESTLIQVKRVSQGEKIGYGATYEAVTDEWIGTVPVGYADGLRRSFQGFEVIVDGEKAEIVGRICMDQFMVRLKRAVRIGTKVTIFGRNGTLFNSVQSGAEYVNTINYEITCGLSDRLPREYVSEMDRIGE